MKILLGLTTAAAVLAMTAPAFAQQYTARSGAEARTRVSFACGNSIAPSFDVAVPPRNGTVVIRRIEPEARMTCPNGRRATAARAAFYTPRAGFTGRDEFTLAWLSPRRGESPRREVVVNVTR